MLAVKTVKNYVSNYQFIRSSFNFKFHLLTYRATCKETIKEFQNFRWKIRLPLNFKGVHRMWRINVGGEEIRLQFSAGVFQKFWFYSKPLFPLFSITSWKSLQPGVKFHLGIQLKKTMELTFQSKTPLMTINFWYNLYSSQSWKIQSPWSVFFFNSW